MIDANHDKLQDQACYCLRACIKNAPDKLAAYEKICRNEQFDHICWVACAQQITLYMGMQLAPTQSYWSMKYHSIIMPTIQKYAGLGFGGKSFSFDHVEWFRGRAFPELMMPKVKSREQLRLYLRNQNNIQVDSFVVGCLVRAEKLYAKGFWNSIIEILNFADCVFCNSKPVR